VTRPTKGGNPWLNAVDRVKRSIESATSEWIEMVLLDKEDIEYYVGLDINHDLLEIANDRYNSDEKVTTLQCDFLRDEYTRAGSSTGYVYRL